MGKRIIDKEMKFDIITNGNNAQKELFALEKSTSKLTEENKQLSLQKKQMERDGLKEPKVIKRLPKLSGIIIDIVSILCLKYILYVAHR